MNREKHLLIKKWLPGRAKWTNELMLADKDKELDVICLASGKTGSSALATSFYYMGCNVLHVHGTKYFLERVVKKPAPPYDNFTVMDFINFINSAKHNKGLVIVDAFRDPIDRKISSFFQVLQRVHMKRINELDNSLGRDWETFVAYYLNHIEDLIRKFNAYFLVQNENYYAYDEWQNDGLTISPGMFNKNQKYSIYNHNGKKYFLLRFDRIGEWQTIFRQNGFPGFTLYSKNLSTKKNYSKLYRSFKDNYFFDSTKQIEKIFNQQHKNRYETFLTQYELSQLKDKWYSKVK